MLTFTAPLWRNKAQQAVAAASTWSSSFLCPGCSFRDSSIRERARARRTRSVVQAGATRRDTAGRGCQLFSRAPRDRRRRGIAPPEVSVHCQFEHQRALHPPRFIAGPDLHTGCRTRCPRRRMRGSPNGLVSCYVYLERARTIRASGMHYLDPLPMETRPDARCFEKLSHSDSEFAIK